MHSILSEEDMGMLQRLKKESIVGFIRLRNVPKIPLPLCEMYFAVAINSSWYGLCTLMPKLARQICACRTFRVF